MKDDRYRFIPLKRYEELLEAENALNTLYAAGVDNWEGFEDAISASKE